MYPFAAVILLVGLLNHVLPRHYAFFAFDHASFIAPPFAILWTGTALLMLGAAALLPIRRRAAAGLQVGTALLLVASLGLFRTPVPGLQGDGESGGYPPMHSTARLYTYPNLSGRLHSFLSDAVKAASQSRVDCPYQFSNLLHQDRPTQSASILVTLLTGGVLMATVMLWTRRRLAPANRLGISLLLLSSPAMLGAYGHFDSYIVPSALVMVWYMALRDLLRQPRRMWRHGWLVVVSILAVWAHPLLGLLPCLSLALGLWYGWVRLCRARGWCTRGRWGLLTTPPGTAVVAAGLLAGFLPGLLLNGRPEFLHPELASLRGALLHEKLMSALQAAFTPCLLAAVAWRHDPSRMRRLSPFQAFCVFGGTFTFTMMITMRLGYGIKDEFIYSMLGQIVLGAAVFGALTCRADRRLLLYAGVLSVFLFVPRVYLNGSRLLSERMLAYMPHDPCWANRELSPYWLAAQCLPLDTEDYRQARLAILEEGFRNPRPMWSSDLYRERSLALYAAWCCAFEDKSRGLPAIRALVSVSPWYLQELWRSPGIFGTDRYNPHAPWIARTWSEDVRQALPPPSLQERAAAQVPWDRLEQLQRDQPPAALLPGGGRDAASCDLYRLGYALGTTLRNDDARKGLLRDRVALTQAAEEQRNAADSRHTTRQQFGVWRLGLFDGYGAGTPVIPLESRTR
ncbi:MAG: hypothetical protein K8T26_04640 [Lentisphaerae bacterium]|nr:hypothetical protein [Lentisphaerota bacterium]